MNDLQTDNISGNIKTMNEYYYQLADESKREDYTFRLVSSGNFRLSYSDHSIFNRFGNATERKRLNAKGNLIHQNIFTHNQNNKLVMHYIFEPCGVSMKNLYRYDSTGTCRGMLFFIYGFVPSQFHQISETDHYRSQNDIYHINKDYDLELHRTIFYTNDDKGNLVEIKTCNANGKVMQRILSTYDLQNREKKRVIKDPNETTILIVHYDERGNEKESVYHDTENDIKKHYRNEYDFDHNGNFGTKNNYSEWRSSWIRGAGV